MLIRKIYNKISSMISVYFYYTGKPKTINPISYSRRNYEETAKREISKLDGGKLYRFLYDVIEKSESTGCEFSDYLTILNELKKYKPRNILECGSGVSTVVFAYYISKLEDPSSVNFVSMESVEYWHEQIKNIFPEELKENVNLCFSERAETYYNGILGSHYKELPAYKYDYIFIDGPGLRKVFNDKTYPKAFNSDVINILLDNPEQTISGILDQRIDTLWKLKKLIPDGSIRYKPSKKVSFLKEIKGDHLIKNLEVKPNLED